MVVRTQAQLLGFDQILFLFSEVSLGQSFWRPLNSVSRISGYSASEREQSVSLGNRIV